MNEIDLKIIAGALDEAFDEYPGDGSLSLYKNR